MRRSFRENRSGYGDTHRWGSTAFTDEEVSKRFVENAAASSIATELMDEASARRMVSDEMKKERAQAALAMAFEAPEPEDKRPARGQTAPAPSTAAPQSPTRHRHRYQDAAGFAAASRSRSRSRSRTRHRPTWTAPSYVNAPAPAAPAAAPAEGLKVGTVVKLKALKAAAHLNGQLGVLDKFDAETGRWEVKLRDGDVKAIKAGNLEVATAMDAAVDGMVTPPAPAAASSATTATAPAANASASSPASAAASGLPTVGMPPVQATPPPEKPKMSRRFGTIRWYNGRRKCGSVIPQGGGEDLFIPAQGAPNGSQAPPQPGGLFHGTRVSFMPLSLKRDSHCLPGQGVTETVCMDVRPTPHQEGLQVGVASDAGAKEGNDDRICATDLQELGFLAGVFDGHRGHSCADYVAKNMPTTILNNFRARMKKHGNLLKLSDSKETDDIAASVTDAFEQIDKAWLVSSRKKELLDGSTGIVALLCHGFEVPLIQESNAPLGCAAMWPKPKESVEKEQKRQPGTVAKALGGVAKLFVAWAGDCRLVLLRGRHGMRISEDHKPNKNSERERIKKAGGMILQDTHGTWRVGPRADNRFARELQKGKQDPSKMKCFLSTCRGFGDPELKSPDPILTATPDIRVVDLVPEDWAIFLGSDGLFEKLSDQVIADILFKSLAQNGRDPAGASRDVVRAALGAGTRDNVTAIVMRLGWTPPPTADSNPPSTEGEASDSLNIFGG